MGRLCVVLMLSLGLAGCLFGESDKLTYPEAVRMFGTPSQTLPDGSGGKTVVFERAGQAETFTLTFDKSEKCVGYNHTAPQTPPPAAAQAGKDQPTPTSTHSAPVIGSRCS